MFSMCEAIVDGQYCELAKKGRGPARRPRLLRSLSFSSRWTSYPQLAPDWMLHEEREHP